MTPSRLFPSYSEASSLLIPGLFTSYSKAGSLIIPRLVPLLFPGCSRLIPRLFPSYFATVQGFNFRGDAHGLMLKNKRT